MKHTTREERLAARDKLFRSRYETIQRMGFSQLSQLHLLSTRKAASFCATSAFLFSPHLVTVARFLLNGKNTDDAVPQAVSDYLVEKRTEAADMQEKIQDFLSFKTPDAWSKEECDAFETCRTELNQFKYTGHWCEYVDNFREWHREFSRPLFKRPPFDKKSNVDCLQHAWLAENPLHRVFWGWTFTGIPQN